MLLPEDEGFMRRALALAAVGAAAGEVPVGAVLVRNGIAVGEGYNKPISACDPTAHAEIVALRAAASQCGNYRLPGTTLYVTIEPCTMCVGALIHARVARLVFGATEPKAGALVSNLCLAEAQHWNHRLEIAGGLCADAATELIQKFFRERRASARRQE